MPDGQTFSVLVAKEQHELVHQSGWNTFANAYKLEEGDILLFGYSGNSHFKVRIFNVSGCDKLLSCATKNITPGLQQRSVCHGNPMRSPRERLMLIVGTFCVPRANKHNFVHFQLKKTRALAARMCGCI